MRTPRIIHVEKLDRAESEAILARNHIGRLAYAFRGGIDIEPIGYVYSEGWIYGRTSAGAKLTALQYEHRVAFEVDEVVSVFEWRSVVVHGAFHPLRPVGSRRTQETWERAVELLRRLIPETMTPADPVPYRWFVFGIVVQEITGRSSSTARESA